MDQRKRAQAAELFGQGCSRAEVARRLGVARATAGRWYGLWEQGGRRALLARRRPGRAPRLGTRAQARVNAALEGAPRDHGFDLDDWSMDAVAALIECTCGVRYHRRHIGRLLRRMGWIVPPIGASAGAALRGVGAVDPDGTPLLLLVRRP